MNIFSSSFPSRLGLALALLLPLLLGACDAQQGQPVTGDLLVTSEVVSAQGASAAEVRLRMGAGQLNVSGGAEALMEADFRYNAEEWRPEVEYEVEGETGLLTVRQPARLNLSTDLTTLRYEWDVRLTDSMPISLDVDLGAGPSDINLSQVRLVEFVLGMGAGDAQIDVSGDYQNDVRVDVRGGVGKLTLRVPSGIGVVVQVRSGLGSVVTTGLTRQDDGFVNAALGVSPVTMTVLVAGGVGEINVDVVD
jgi:hypothetical protein